MLDEFAKTYLSAGNLAAAQRSAEESNAILQPPRRVRRGQQGRERNLSVSLIRLGDVKRAQGDGPGALAAYEADARQRPQARGGRHGQPRAPSRTSRSISTGSPTSSSMPATAPARSRPMRRASAIRRALVAADPLNTERQRAMSVSLGKICDVKRDAGDAKGALAACEEELAIARRLARVRPGQYRVAARRGDRAGTARRPQAQRGRLRRRAGRL